MGRDAFGLFRGWCKKDPRCLEYCAAGEPNDPVDVGPLRCTRCRCLPQEHVPAVEEGYDPNSEAQLAERRKHDVRLLPPEERAAIFKARADAAFKERNFRTAYLEYTRAIEATPDDHKLLGNRCQTYLKVHKVESALKDAERCVSLAPDWAKGQYRHGVCLQLSDQHVEAVAAFERACSLDPDNKECKKALNEARGKKAAWDETQEKLAKARKRTTIRQAADAYEEAKYEFKQAAKKSGRIPEITHFGGELEQEFEREYKANIRPPAGVEYALTYNPSTSNPEGEEEEERIVELEENVEDGEEEEGDDNDNDGGPVTIPMLEENDEEDGNEGGGFSALLEDNAEDAGSDAESDDSSTEFDSDEDDEDEAKRAQEQAMLDDSKFVPETKEGSTALSLPPRNYILVHEDGTLHKKDDFEPMSFGMQRIHNNDEPEPVWVQTRTARWLQTLIDVTIIPHTVPKELCKSSEIKISFSRRQVHVQAIKSKQIYMAGELHRPIDPNQSTWTTDGEYITIVCVKENLCLYDNSKGVEADTHWHRLFETDQYVERGMVAANYNDLPYHMKHRNKMNEEKRKAKEAAEKAANLCVLCGKDVRFFCECRAYDKDYERPLPQGWKDSELGFSDNYDKYSSAEPELIQQRPPEQPRPYQGRTAPKYGLDGKALEGQDALPGLRMLKETA